MCELFGYSGSAPGRLNDLLTEFFAHSCAHPDGWGLAVPDGGHMEIEKEPLQASRSEYLRERLQAPLIYDRKNKGYVYEEDYNALAFADQSLMPTTAR